MIPTTEQLRARLAAELDELGPMPDVSARAARAGGRIVRRRRIAAGWLAGVVGVGACSLLGAMASGALPGSGGQVADRPTPRPVPSPVPLPPHVPELTPAPTPVVPSLPVPPQPTPRATPAPPMVPVPPHPHPTTSLDAQTYPPPPPAVTPTPR
jgi:hypothetical protein